SASGGGWLPRRFAIAQDPRMASLRLPLCLHDRVGVPADCPRSTRLAEVGAAINPGPIRTRESGQDLLLLFVHDLDREVAQRTPVKCLVARDDLIEAPRRQLLAGGLLHARAGHVLLIGALHRPTRIEHIDAENVIYFAECES